MPIYEYRCEACGAAATVFVRRAGDPAPACSRCHSPRMSRLLSRFASPRSDEARMDALADPSSLAGLDENDPRSVARWMKRMGRETGEEFGEGLEEEIERAADDPAADQPAALDTDSEP